MGFFANFFSSQGAVRSEGIPMGQAMPEGIWSRTATLDGEKGAGERPKDIFEMDSKYNFTPVLM